MAQQKISKFSTDAETPAENSEKADADNEEEQPDPVSRLKELPQEVAELRDNLSREEFQLETLAGVEKELKQLEDDIEETRKETVEPQLDEEIEIGETVAGLRRQTGHNKFVYDAEETLETLEENGVDPMEVCKPKASDVKDALETVGIDPEEHVGQAEYDFYYST